VIHLAKQRLIDFAKTTLQYWRRTPEPHLTEIQLRNQLIADEIKQASHLTPQQKASLIRRALSEKK
jgi:hypothetical protein